jgi:hypothetical protein
MGPQSQSQPQFNWGFPQIIAGREDDHDLIGIYQQVPDHFDLSILPIVAGLSVMGYR